MKEYKVIIDNHEYTIKQDCDGKFYKPPFVREYEKFGSCLKPAYEPIIVARKPFNGTLIDNVLEYGVGGLNIDECRIEHNETQKTTTRKPRADREVFNTKTSGFDSTKNHVASAAPDGRFPANLILSYDEDDKDEVCGGFPKSNKPNGSITKKYKMDNQIYGNYGSCNTYISHNDKGSAARYFYCAKASKRDRDEGLEDFEAKAGHSKGNGLDRVCEFCGTPQLKAEDCHCETKSWVAKPKRNTHTTVKPTALMQYLVRLVAPKGSTILDPFMGSGSTGKAVAYENLDRDANYKFIGIEMEKEYCDIARARINYVYEKGNDD